MTTISSSKTVILFDGVCKFCNASVNYIFDNDGSKEIYFITQQSEAGQNILEHFGLKGSVLDSLVFIKAGVAYQKSEGVLKIVKQMGGKYAFLSGVGYCFPKFFRDWVYDRIAKNRYRLFGKEDACRMPNAEMKNRFL